MLLISDYRLSAYRAQKYLFSSIQSGQDKFELLSKRREREIESQRERGAWGLRCTSANLGESWKSEVLQISQIRGEPKSILRAFVRKIGHRSKIVYIVDDRNKEVFQEASFRF